LVSVDVDVTGFPVAPVAGGLLADRRVRGLEQPGIAVDDAAVTFGLG
jgi:hypothetical protein